MTLLDTEPVVLEELDFETPCECEDGHGDPCSHPARWSWYWSCECISPFCQIHHEWSSSLQPDGWFCEPHNCETKVLRVEPLRQGGAS